MLDPSRNITVLIWDPNSERLDRIARLAKSCGAESKQLSDTAQLNPAVDSTRTRVALVALGDSRPQTSERLSIIRSLKLQGVKVLSYAPDVFSWPIALRCRSLLSGASLLFDTASSTFSEDLFQ